MSFGTLFYISNLRDKRWIKKMKFCIMQYGDFSYSVFTFMLFFSIINVV